MKIREYIETKIGTASFARTIDLNDVESLFDIIEDYTKLKVEQAVEVALRVASENLKQTAGQWNSDFSGQKKSILSLAPQIMEELNIPTTPQT